MTDDEVSINDMRDYVFNVCRTESTNFDEIKDRLDNDLKLRILHGAMGICTEGGELLDAVKKHIFYGKDLDIVNIKEEIGDALYYIAVICDVCDFDFYDVCQINIDKLKARYGDRFSSEKALNRDLDKEREILEDK